MKAAVCYEFGTPLKIEEIELAEPGEGEVLVKVAATAICHSDIHDIKGELPGPLPFAHSAILASTSTSMASRASKSVV